MHLFAPRDLHHLHRGERDGGSGKGVAPAPRALPDASRYLIHLVDRTNGRVGMIHDPSTTPSTTPRVWCVRACAPGKAHLPAPSCPSYKSRTAPTFRPTRPLTEKRGNLIVCRDREGTRSCVQRFAPHSNQTLAGLHNPLP